MTYDMLQFSDDEEESLWIEFRKESGSPRVDMSEGESLLRSEEFETLDSCLLSLETSFTMHFREGRGIGHVSISILI